MNQTAFSYERGPETQPVSAERSKIMRDHQPSASQPQATAWTHEPSTTEKLAEYFRDRQGIEVTADDVYQACGRAHAWRTRVSNLRYAPFYMDVRNRLEQHGRKKHSFYRFVGNM